jgi:hypothetical protein
VVPDSWEDAEDVSVEDVLPQASDAPVFEVGAPAGSGNLFVVKALMNKKEKRKKGNSLWFL